MKAETGLVLALDVTDGERGLELVDAVWDHVDALKVNYPLILSQGLGFLDELPRPSIADLKVADVPNTNRLICGQVNSRVDGLIAHAFTGEQSLKSCVRNFDGEVYAVVDMTHAGAETFFGANRGELLDAAVSAGVDGVVAPATRPRSIEYVKERTDLAVLAPGVGAQGGRLEETVGAGADFVIVGRAIYDAPEPAEAAEELSRRTSELLQEDAGSGPE